MFFSELYMANSAWMPDTKLWIRTRNGTVQMTANKCHLDYGDLQVDYFYGQDVWLFEYFISEDGGEHGVNE